MYKLPTAGINIMVVKFELPSESNIVFERKILRKIYGLLSKREK